MQNLPSLYKIAYLPCSELQPQILNKSVAGVPVGILAATTPISLESSGTYEAVDDFVSNTRQEKVTLTFRSFDNVPTLGHHAFVVTNAQGNSYLIGTREHPFPIVKVSDTSGSPSGEPSVKTYTVTYSAQRALVPCIQV